MRNVSATDQTILAKLDLGFGSAGRVTAKSSKPGANLRPRHAVRDVGATIVALNERTVTHHGDLAWAFVQSLLKLTYADRIERRPYRILAIFQNVDGAWYWRLLSAWEPTSPAQRFAPLAAVSSA